MPLKALFRRNRRFGDWNKSPYLTENPLAYLCQDFRYTTPFILLLKLIYSIATVKQHLKSFEVSLSNVAVMPHE